MSIFPLPLNAIEHYMLADDSADYPRLFWLLVRVDAQIEESRLQRAVQAATARHPMLRAIVEYDGHRPRRWIECRDPQYSICWLEAGRISQRTVEPIDLRHVPGVRFCIERNEDGDTLTIEFHHATTDGIGAVQFVRDLLVLYEADSKGSTPNLQCIDATRLTKRDSFGLNGWRRPLRWIYGTLGWLGAIEYLSHRPAPLGRIDRSAASEKRQSGFCSLTLSEEETRSLFESARRDGATVNDRLIRDVFVAIQAFTERHAPDRNQQHKRIMVPTNLRAVGDESLPAANVVAMVNIDRRPHRWTDRRQMLRVLHRELEAVKRLRLGIVFVQILGTLQWLFGSLRRFLPADRCQATCVVSNLGIVLSEFSPVTIRGVEFYPPIRPLTAAAFGAATHGGRLSLSLHFDAAAISADEGSELLDLVVGQLLENAKAIASKPELAAIV